MPKLSADLPRVNCRRMFLYIADPVSAQHWRAEHLGSTFEEGFKPLVDRLVRCTINLTLYRISPVPS